MLGWWDGYTSWLSSLSEWYWGCLHEGRGIGAGLILGFVLGAAAIGITLAIDRTREEGLSEEDLGLGICAGIALILFGSTVPVVLAYTLPVIVFIACVVGVFLGVFYSAFYICLRKVTPEKPVSLEDLQAQHDEIVQLICEHEAELGS